MTQALVLVDIQNDYFPGGPMELEGMTAATDNARAVLESFRANDAPLFHVQHLSLRPDATFFVPDTPGAEHHEAVAPASGESVIQKNYPNAFRATDLESRLRGAGIGEVIIVGAMSHMCIDATTRAAFDLGFRCTVVEDACATRDLVFKERTVAAGEVHAAFMAALSPLYATVTQTHELIGR